MEKSKELENIVIATNRQVVISTRLGSLSFRIPSKASGEKSLSLRQGFLDSLLSLGMTTLLLFLLFPFIFSTKVYAAELSNQFTVSLWVKPEVSIASKALVAKAEEIRLATDGSGNPLCQIKVSTWQTAATSSTAIVVNSWSFVTCTYDKTTLHVFVNGVQTGSQALTSTVDDTANAFKVGEDDSSGGTYADLLGVVDDLKIYSYARTVKQIVQDMNAGHPAVGSPVGSAVAHYKFDEGYGTTANNFGNGGSTLNGTLTGMASPATSTSGWTNSGKFGKALNFDGSNDYVDIGNVVNTSNDDQVSICLWARPTSVGGGTTRHLVGFAGSTVNDQLFSYYINSSGNQEFDQFPPSGGNVSGQAVTADSWQHLCMVYSGSSNLVTFYKNGVGSSVAYADTYSGSNSIQGSIGGFWISPTLYNPYSGLIDEVKIYNYALSEDEVKVEYNQGKAVVLGSTSTESNGTTASNSSSREYCVPGDTSTCNPPVAHYKMDEGTGTSAQDTTGNANTGTLTGGPTWTQGKKGKAVRFDGTNYVQVSNNSSLNIAGANQPISISAWINWVASTETYNSILSKEDGGLGNGYALLVKSNGKLAFYVQNNGGNINIDGEGSAISTGQWVHVTGVFDGSNIKTYINGAVDYTKAATITSTSNSSSLYIGASLYGSGRRFNGLIDDVRIYNYARTPAQIAWEYNRGAPVAWYKMDECQGTTISDWAPNANGGFNGNNGTLTVGAGGTQTSAGTCTSGNSAHAWANGSSGKTNSSLNFDGTDDYVNLGTALNSSLIRSKAFSLGAWIKTSVSTDQQIITNSDIDSPYTGIELVMNSNGTVTFNLNQNALKLIRKTTTATINNGNWRYIYITYSGSGAASGVSIYIDGVAVSTTTNYDNTDADTTSSTNLEIGARDGTNTPFSGQIDDVRIFNYALTPAQIKDVYNGGAVSFR